MHNEEEKLPENRMEIRNEERKTNCPEKERNKERPNGFTIQWQEAFLKFFHSIQTLLPLLLFVHSTRLFSVLSGKVKSKELDGCLMMFHDLGFMFSSRFQGRERILGQAAS